MTQPAVAIFCGSGTTLAVERAFRPLFVRQEDFEKHQPKDFAELLAAST
jgi:hypothetical protein